MSTYLMTPSYVNSFIQLCLYKVFTLPYKWYIISYYSSSSSKFNTNDIYFEITSVLVWQIKLWYVKPWEENTVCYNSSNDPHKVWILMSMCKLFDLIIKVLF